MQTFNEKFAEYLALKRIRENLLQGDIAKMIGVNVMTVSGYVTGKIKKPHRLVAQKIVEITKGEITMKDMGYDV